MLSQPDSARDLDGADWSRLVRQARTNGLLGQVLNLLAECRNLDTAPDAVKRLLSAERHLADHRKRALLWEADELRRTLAPLGVEPVLIKGGAYIAEGMPHAHFRHFGDIDVLVPPEVLAAVEKRLLTAGWAMSNRDPYDQYYYRTWMHELPPLRHIKRGTHLDLHHTITPRTSRYATYPEKLFAQARQATSHASLSVLSTEDQFLHGAAHLFSEGEAGNALRDLFDLRALLRHIDDLAVLRDRAEELRLQSPLALALRHIERNFPDPSVSKLADAAGRWAHGAQRLDVLYDRVFVIGCERAETGNPSLGKATEFVLNCRGHWLRMPVALLARHLTRKALKQLFSREPSTETVRN
ncbi:MAG: nucleotidyltransferase family protein [Rhodocyclaceae bacterium]|nr:nucleotidyltransferase family protein [Rhodocyclaceae bacterium]